MAQAPMFFLSLSALGFFLSIDFLLFFLLNLSFNDEFVLDFLLNVFNRI
jgi:hypothetical protein